MIVSGTEKRDRVSGPAFLPRYNMKEVGLGENDEQYEEERSNRKDEQGKGEAGVHPPVLIEVGADFYGPPPCNQGNASQDGPYIYVEEYYAVVNDVIDEKHKLHQYQQCQYDPSHGTPPVRRGYAVNSTII